MSFSAASPDELVNILERIGDGFVAFDAQMNYTYVNQRAGELLGRAPADLIGKNYWTEYPDAAGTPFADAYRRSFATQAPIFFEDYYAPFDRWFENRIYPTPDGLAIFFTEITARKRAEQALKDKEQFIAAVVETAPAIVYVYDLLTHANVFLNAGFERLLGYSAAEIQAMGAELFARLLHPADLPAVTAFQEALSDAADGAVLEIEYRIQHKHGGWRILHSYETPFRRDLAGGVIQKIGVAIDVTAVRQSEARILRLNRLYATLSHINHAITHIEAAQTLFQEICRVVITEGRYRMAWIGLYDAANATARPVAWAGEELGYLGDRSPRTIDLHGGHSPLETALREGRCVVRSEIHSDPGMAGRRASAGERGYRSLAAVPFRCQERVIGVLMVYAGEVDAFDREDERLLEEIGADISHALDTYEIETQRRNGVEALRAAHELLRQVTARLAETQESERRLLAHELHDRVGQSLTALGINLNLIRSRLDPGVQHALADYFYSAQTLITEITDQVRAVMAELHPPVLDEYGLAAALRWHAARLQQQTGLQIDVVGDLIEPRLPAAVSIALFRIAQEALNNIIKHAHATQTRVTLEATGDAVLMTIVDDGRGFDPLDPIGDGMHWGLAIMRERAEAVNGVFAIDSLPDRGARLAVRVPYAGS